MSSSQSKREILRNKRKEQKRRRTMTFVFITLGVVVLFGLAALLPRILMTQSKFGSARGFPIGDPDAPITVVQFSNYGCPYCKDFSDDIEQNFINTYVNSGEVYYRYVNLPSDSEQSQTAAKASYCAAEQDRFYDYKDFLYENVGFQDGFSITNLINYATTAGLDVDKFQTCLADDTYAKTYLEDIRYAQSVGVSGTPTFLVNDQLVSSAELIPLVDSLLNE